MSDNDLGDNIVRTPIEENVWYNLMTIAGEQTENKIDEKIHDKNRYYWNKYFKYYNSYKGTLILL